MRRTWIALGVTAAPLIVASVLALGLRDRLPEKLAIHWSTNVQPDNFADRDTMINVLLIVAAATFLAGVITTFALRRRGRIVVGVLGVITGLVASLLLTTVVVNLDLDDPRDARIGWESALPIALMAATGLLAWWAYGRQDTPVVPATEPPPAHLPRLSDGEVPTYSDSHIDWAVAALTLILLSGTGVFVWVALTPWLGAELIIVAVAVASLAYTRVIVPRAGNIEFASGPLKHRIPIVEISGAEARDIVEPAKEFGGRGIRYRPKVVGMVRRRGPGVDIDRTDGRRVVITTDDADRLARVLNTLADER